MAEEIFGKLFTKEEADEQFGVVLSSKELDTAVLSDLCEKSENVLMFNLKDESPVILGKGRVPLHPDAGLQVSFDEVFHVFSISVIKELLAADGNGKVTIEKRESHLTITNGQSTLEMSGHCPPYC